MKLKKMEPIKILSQMNRKKIEMRKAQDEWEMVNNAHNYKRTGEKELLLDVVTEKIKAIRKDLEKLNDLLVSSKEADHRK